MQHAGNGGKAAHWVAYEDNAAWKLGQVASSGGKALRLHSGEKILRRRVWLDPAPPPSAALDDEVAAIVAELPVEALWRAAAGKTLTLPQLTAAAGGEGDIWQIAVLQQVLANPIYFQRRGNDITATDSTTVEKAKAALAVRRQQQEEEETLQQALAAGALPAVIRAAFTDLLTAPVKNSPPYRALRQHLGADGVAFAQFFLQHGLLRDELHYQELLFAHKWQAAAPAAPEEAGAAEEAEAFTTAPPPLPAAAQPAFSIDDAGTKEVDDAFSLTALPQGGWRLGIHIAAPALMLTPAADAVARARQTSVYFPHDKHFMLPAAAVQACSLTPDAPRPALSLYLHLQADLEDWTEEETVLEMVQLSGSTSPAAIDDGSAPPPLKAQAAELQRVAAALMPRFANAAEYPNLPPGFMIKCDTMTIGRREREGIARTVEILMRAANSLWAARLAAAKTGGLYRQDGKLLLRPQATPYMWLTSPLRRYVDLANQRALLALLADATPPEEDWHALRQAFGAQQTMAHHFQRAMEQHWTLAILQHDAPAELGGVYQGQRRVRLDDYPLMGTLPRPLPHKQQEQAVTVRVEKIDLLAQRLFVALAEEGDA